jgi:hypothetical protein
VLVPDRPFQPSLMLVCLARDYPSGGKGISSRVDSENIRLVARDERSSSFGQFVNYGCKVFYSVGSEAVFLVMCEPSMKEL